MFSPRPPSIQEFPKQIRRRRRHFHKVMIVTAISLFLGTVGLPALAATALALKTDAANALTLGCLVGKNGKLMLYAFTDRSATPQQTQRCPFIHNIGLIVIG